MGRQRGAFPTIPVGLRLQKPTVDRLTTEAWKHNEKLGTYIRRLLEQYAPAPELPLEAGLRPPEEDH